MKLVVAFLLVPLISFTQSVKKNHPTLLGPRFNLLQFKPKQPFSSSRKMDDGVGMQFIKGLSAHIDWQLSVDGSFSDSASKQKRNSRSLLLQSDISLRLRLFLLEKKFQPFLTVGTGIQTYREQVGVCFPLGMGMQWNFFKEIYLLSQAQWRLTVPTNINQHLFFSIGFSGRLTGGQRKQSSKPIKEMAIVPPILPRDTDQDGVIDSLDLCPEAAGMAIFNGCPDTDKDGTPDKEDACPLLFGLVELKGCPVPDTDGDGLDDKIDSCIMVPGPADNQGCPRGTLQLTKRLAFAAKFIQFETGSATLDKKSYQYLDSVFVILYENPTLHLSIEGHTDNTSTPVFNSKLSEARASTVMAYFVSRGIESARLLSKGWGQTKPIAENRTKEGRSINRRVELIPGFE